VGHVPGKGKYTGKLGALWLEQPTDSGHASEGHAPRRFKLGSGFSDAQREAPPPVGAWVSYRFRGQTEAGVPRFASFLRLAEREL
jgi:DNA ligase-1